MLLKYSWFTMLYQFLLYSKVIQLHVYIHSFQVLFYYGFSRILNIVLQGYWIYSRTLLSIHSIYNSLNLLTPNSHSFPLNLQHPLDHRESKRIPGEKNLFYWLTKAFDCVNHNKLRKTLKEMGIPNHLTCLLRNLYAGQETAVRILYGNSVWSKTEKEVWQGCLLYPVCLTYMQSTSYKMPGWMIYELEARLTGEISATSDM